MEIKVGEVISVKGTKIILKIFEDSGKDTLFYKGSKFKGVSIREHLLIQRGFIDIICIVEGEYLDESNFEIAKSSRSYIRKVEVKPIGYYKNGKFFEGVKFLPMIKNSAFLMPQERVIEIYTKKRNSKFVIGKMLKDSLPISLPWQRLFNSHIGIFGNTGSGKSNTLAKLYTVLFEQKKNQIRQRSKFVLFDFNGEYSKDQFALGNDKIAFNLNTSRDDGDKFPLSPDDFWDPEILCILFKATESTQRPFLNRMIKGRERFKDIPNSLTTYLKATFRRAFTSTSPKRETAELLIQILRLLDEDTLEETLNDLTWHGNQSKFQTSSGQFLNGSQSEFDGIFEPAVSQLNCERLDVFDELIVRVNLQLLNDLLSEFVQFDFIQPLLKRIESSSFSLKRVVDFSGATNNKLLNAISMRRCNQEIKKVLPLLIAKHYYEYHKNNVANPPDKTMHLIIDEAHNILSQQSIREQESWKDYRLELFEEIIKEGRKFGVFLTLASQRPADISPTIMSQVHNFFIHRLVNEKDLLLVSNTVSTLDTLSREMIPSLATGCCIVTGTSFDLPLVIEVDLLKKELRPDSEDVDLEILWSDNAG
jgi:DNA helicase HerA-like ATPase